MHSRGRHVVDETRSEQGRRRRRGDTRAMETRRLRRHDVGGVDGIEHESRYT